TLKAGATLLLWDAMASGRVARGERWASHSFESEIRIESATGKLLLDRYCLRELPGRLIAEWDYIGSLYLVADTAKPEVWKEMDEQLIEALNAWPGRVLAGLSEPACGGRGVKLLARSAPNLQTALEAAWEVARRFALGV